MNLTHSNTFELIIVGAGPAGLACAIEAKNAGLHYTVVDKGNIVNSIQNFQRNMFFFSTPELLEIGNVPFIISTTRPTSLDCVNYYRKVCEVHQINTTLHERIESAVRKNGDFSLKTSASNTLTTRSVVIATGYYDTPSMLDVTGEDLPFVSHFYRDPLPFYKQRVLIVGGKNSAVEAALDLYRHGAKVTVVHRGPALSSGVKYWILPDFENRVTDGSITLMLNTVVKQFKTGAAVLEQRGSEQWTEEFDYVFVLIGYRPDVRFLQKVGIEINSESLAPMHNPETFETNIVNMFVAGGMVGGKYNNKIFIENGREHGKRIIEALRSR